MDEYIRDPELQVEVLPPIQPAHISSAVDESISNRGADCPLEDVLVNRELQKLNKQVKKQLSQIVELKKQSNMMAGAFCVCIIALYVVYLCRSD